jgi:hypothetical protein
MLVQVSTKVKWLLSVLETVNRPLLYASILFHKPKATSYNYQSQKKEFFEKRQLRRADLLCTRIQDLCSEEFVGQNKLILTDIHLHQGGI